MSFTPSLRGDLDVYHIYSGNDLFFQLVIRFWSWQDNHFHTQASAVPIRSHTTSSFAGLAPVWVVCFQEVCSCGRWLSKGGVGAEFSMVSLDMTAKPCESIMHHPLADPPINNLCLCQLVSIRSLQRSGSQGKAVGVRLKTENIYLFLKNSCPWSHSELWQLNKTKQNKTKHWHDSLKQFPWHYS